MSQLPSFRVQLSTLAKLAIPVAAVAVAIAIPAEASSGGPPAARSAQPGSRPQQPALIAPLIGIPPRTAAQAATASSTCVRYATRAGWANNGYYAGDLVTAAAVCGGESRGDPRLYVCDQNGLEVGHGDFVPGQPINCPAGTTSYDRGLWQLNNVAASSTSNACAFNPVCNAGAAYLASDRGTNFSPWSSYDMDKYTTWIDPAQAAVTGQHSGTVTSAELGECLQAKSAA